MSFQEGSKWQEYQEDIRRHNEKYGKDEKYQKQSEAKSMIGDKSLQELAKEYNWSGEELMQASCFVVAMRMHKKGIDPTVFMKVVNNWERIEKAIQILKHDLL